MMPPPPLPDETFAALPPVVQAYIRSLEAATAQGATLQTQHATLQTRVAELDARLGQSLSNSSKPPSSDDRK